MTVPQALDLALQHHQAGRLPEAETLYRQILAAQPNHADALHLVGLIAHQVGRHDLAVEWICKAIALDPNYPAAHCNLGEAYRALRRFDEAIASYRRALALKADYPEAQYNLGIALRERGQLEEAVAEFRGALKLKPDYLEAHINLGNALSGRGQFDEAIAAYRRALELRPNFPEIHNNLGNALRNRGRFDEAIAAYHRALELKPDYPEAYNNLGIALKSEGRLDDAAAACRHALALQPDLFEASNTLGIILKDLGQIDEAVASYRRALQSERADSSIHGNLVYALHFHPGQDAKSIGEERQRWNRQFGDPLKQFILPHANNRNPERPLRIGYVSPDFRDHVVGRNLMPLFESHDHRSFEILCYSDVAQPDQMTEEFRRRASQWRVTLGMADAALADLIRRDGVDVLVDLTQHMAGNRLTMFARKPAPVQVSFAGYPESAGLDAIEYRISDRYLEMRFADEEAGRNEHLCLIDSFWCYDPCGLEAAVNALPALEAGSVTFGSLGNLAKVNERVLSLWAQVLRTVRDSCLLMRSPAGSHRQRTLKVLEKEGIEERRVEFVEARPRREYLETYHRLDIVLDTFPYNGHTTSLDALWMGVPVVSLAGKTPVSRAGLSQLTNLGLRELVAHSEKEYVNIAESLATDLPHLAHLRATLRDRMKSSPLMDAPRFAGQVELAYREMWRAWRPEQSSLAAAWFLP